jgi:hypothetical protein
VHRNSSFRASGIILLIERCRASVLGVDLGVGFSNGNFLGQVEGNWIWKQYFRMGCSIRFRKDSYCSADLCAGPFVFGAMPLDVE